MSEEWAVPEEVKAPGGGGSSRFVQPKGWMEVKDGKTTVQRAKFRILGKAVSGLVGWTEDNKPVRARSAADFAPGQKWRVSERTDKKGEKFMGEERPKEFWAIPVWEYESTGEVKIWEVAQASIKDAIRALVDQWGSPTGYDLTVTRSGKGFDTKYAVVPSPPSPAPAEALAQWAALQAAGFDLERLFSGGDPFPAAAPAAAPATVADASGRNEIPF